MSDPFRTVQVKNRTGETVRTEYDGQEVAWGPYEARALLPNIARICTRQAIYQWDPITGETRCKLVILGEGNDESNLDVKDTQVVELLDRTHMEPTVFDQDGEPLRPEVKDITMPLGMMRGRGAEGVVPESLRRGLDAAHDKLAEVAVEIGVPD